MSTIRGDLRRYYSSRAPEYDAIYEKPERQRDLLALRRLVSRQLAGRDILEIACGTGYWTECLAGSARSVLATDASPRMLDMAQRRAYPGGSVAFRQADAFALPSTFGLRFNGCFAGFWWSHVPRARWADFLCGLHDRLEPGARCVFVDNRYIQGESTPIAQTDAAGDTYQDRRLSNDSTYRVLKNFPGRGELTAGVADDADGIELTDLRYFWCLSYRCRPPAEAPEDVDSEGEALDRGST